MGTPFAATENVTDPLPVPELPLVTLIHESFETVVHEQPVTAVTVVEPEPPPDATFWLFGEIE